MILQPKVCFTSSYHYSFLTPAVTDNLASSSPPAHGWPSIVIALTVIAGMLFFVRCLPLLMASFREVIIVSIIALAVILHQKPFGEHGIQPRLSRLLLGPNLPYDDFTSAFGLDAHSSTDSRGRGIGRSRDRLVGNV